MEGTFTAAWTVFLHTCFTLGREKSIFLKSLLFWSLLLITKPNPNWYIILKNMLSELLCVVTVTYSTLTPSLTNESRHKFLYLVDVLIFVNYPHFTLCFLKQILHQFALKLNSGLQKMFCKKNLYYFKIWSIVSFLRWEIMPSCTEYLIRYVSGLWKETGIAGNWKKK